MDKEALIGKTLHELQEITSALKLPAFTAKQICEWLYRKRTTNIDLMTNISVKNRELLKENYCVGRTTVVEVMKSEDGTKKYLFQTLQGYIESVFIPEDERATLCVSSQVGCKMDCLFCMTGKQGFAGNLTAGDILNQIFSIPEADQLTNVVLMGMGEPLDNSLAVLRALEILTSDYGCAWSPKRITVSSIGLIPGLKVFLERSKCHLAISLHNPFSEERLKLMPIEKAYPIQDVIKLLKDYDFNHQRRVSFEYILFKGYNDTMRHARELVRILSGLECRVNLIRFHEIPGVDLKSANEEQITWFRDYLTQNNIISTIRKSRGEDILAACGMLSTAKKQEEEKE
ncbi:MAG: 23S rRNA (adenine(2503)-C(2))-methyltransferase RlmN [Paludibacteraceae bacterium]|nr:23S rRNA (adenine(2503)-C(2))-methyltransferase RlmN [Paludibacteraceae bacterium]